VLDSSGKWLGVTSPGAAPKSWSVGRALALDSAGSLLLAGEVSGGPVTIGPVSLTGGGGGNQAFVAKLGPDGTP
jgi:hypothetical protein